LDYAAFAIEELVAVCLDTGDEAAWQEFVLRFHGLIATVALRTARRWGQGSPQVLDDLVQETYLKLCADDYRLLRSFRAKHPDAIYGYVKVLTANLVHDHFKSLHSQKRGGGAKTETIEDQVPRKGLASSRSDANTIERTVLLGQIDACLLEAEKGPNACRDRHIFWLYYRLGLPATAIAGLPTIGLSTKGVESTILRLTRLVRQKLFSGSDSAKVQTIPKKGIRALESL
jgi:RNA polymerase sigma-70 factor (ECF subfamily)